MGSGNVTVSSEILNSWKEIAAYLNRGVRTVQRWEADLGLPVRRPRGKSRSAVVAMRSEIDAWLKACLSGKGNGQNRGDLRPDLFDASIPLHEAVLASRRLRVELTHTRQQLRDSIFGIIETLKKASRDLPSRTLSR